MAMDKIVEGVEVEQPPPGQEVTAVTIGVGVVEIGLEEYSPLIVGDTVAREINDEDTTVLLILVASENGVISVNGQYVVYDVTTPSEVEVTTVT